MKDTLKSLWEEGTKILKEAGVKEASLDARYLLFEAFDTDLTHYLLESNRLLLDDEVVSACVLRYWQMIKVRSKRIPLQQIIGKTVFMGLDFYINESVLIPRQDTETLVELVLTDYKGRKPAVLDMCTGSGCIAVSLAKLGGFDTVTAVDISEEALRVAKQNADMILGEGKINFMESDLFSSLHEFSKFDLIVSNPPYIPTSVIEGLEPEVRDHEPMIALNGEEDGLKFYKKLVLDSKTYLNRGGSVYFEIGYDQKEAVSRLFKDAGYHKIRTVKDAAGLDRVVCAVLE